MPSSSAAAAAVAPAPPALNLAPTKRTEIDLFARAPQVRKMTRKDKQQMALSEAMGEARTKSKKHQRLAAASDATATAGGQVRTPESGTGVFTTVFAAEVDAQAAALEKVKKARQSGRKKSRKQILRHSLHKNEEEDERTAFVGNLPNTIDKKDVARVFKDCGVIESVRVRCQALESRGPVPSSSSGGGQGKNINSDDEDDDDGEGRGAKGGKKDVGRAVRVLRGDIKKDPQYSATAYVLFKEAASVATAIHQKSGVVFKSRHLVVTALGASSAAYPPDTSVFLGNVAYDTTEEDIWDYFTEHGVPDVKRVRLVRDRDSGDCKGFGYVEFHSKASVVPAIATRGDKLNGRDLRIVHVNKSKDVKAVTASRREKRGRDDGGNDSYNSSNKRARHDSRDGRGGSSNSGGGGGQPSWMGMTTNPRRKIPRDLRPLAETNAERKFKGPRPPVKRKMRNPEQG